MTEPLTMERIEAASRATARHARRTPFLHSPWLSAVLDAEVFLKCENLQHTGSFKLRGALAAIASRDPGELEGGVLTSSAGNHGLGLAHAARLTGTACTVVVPAQAAAVKCAAIEREGARVIRCPAEGYDATQSWTLERREELGGVFVSPFDDLDVIAGNGGSLALEMMADESDLDLVAVPCGGGGCAAGVGFAYRERSPKTRVFGVNCAASPGMWQSLRDGRARLELDGDPTIAEGLEGGVCDRTFQLAREYLAGVLLASEAGLRSSVREILLREALVVEGSGAAGVAALLESTNALDGARRIGIVLTGANIDADRLASLLA